MNNKWKILLLDSKRKDPNFYICLQIKKSLKSHKDVESVALVNYFNAISTAKKNNFNLLFVYGGEDINRSICKILRYMCGLSIVWFTEDPYELSNNLDSSELFDYVFTNDPGCVEKYSVKSLYLPLAASKWLHHRTVIQNDDKYRYDISFIGTAWPNRTRFIKNLLSKRKNLRYKLALPTNQYLPDFDLQVPKFELNWRTPNSELSSIANKSKISLVLHREFSGSGNACKAESPGPRIFENAMSGSFLLVDDSLEFNEKLFQPGKEYIPFKDVDECIELIDYYLANPAERIEVAEAAQLKTISEHTYDSRVSAILSEAKVLQSSNAHKNDSVVITKKKLLFVSHNVISRQPFGGVEVYLNSIINKVNVEYDVYIFVPDITCGYGSSYLLLNKDYSTLEKFSYKNKIDDTCLSDFERENGFCKLIEKYNFDIVHYHHLIGHVPSLPFVSKALGVKSILSIHDYYYICDSFNLLNGENKFCNVIQSTMETCDICAYNRNGLLPGEIRKRRAFFERMLSCVDSVIANSQTTQCYYKAIYPGLIDIQVLSIPGTVLQRKNTERVTGRTLKVAILGNFSFNKGANVLIDVFQQMEKDDIEFHVFGRVDERYDINLNNVFMHEGYDVNSISERLGEMTLSLHMSIWPETFCMTLSEAWANGVIPIVTKIGALAERVSNFVDGFIVPVNDAGAVVHVLRMLNSNSFVRESVMQNITKKGIYSIDEHVNSLITLYDEGFMLLDYKERATNEWGITMDNLFLPIVDSKLKTGTMSLSTNRTLDKLEYAPYSTTKGRLSVVKMVAVYKSKGGMRKLISAIRSRGFVGTFYLVSNNLALCKIHADVPYKKSKVDDDKSWSSSLTRFVIKISDIITHIKIK